MSIGRTLVIGTICASAVLAGRVIAAPQAPAASSMATFEVAAIRQSKTEAGGGGITSDPGRFLANGVTLRRLIFSAYNMPMARILEGPEWVNELRFDVTARGDLNATPEQLRQMQQALLRERFNLVVRRAVRDVPAYALVHAQPDKQLGPRIRPATLNCNDAQARAAAPEHAPGTQRPSCGVRTTQSSFRGGAVALTRLIESLTQNAGRPVLDRTGLTGSFDIEVEWAPPPPTPEPGAAVTVPDLPDGPSIFTAVKEQLGLALEADKAPLEVLVIERASLPTDN
jgi:uncharacterized protein (TIGR03435 family)